VACAHELFAVDEAIGDPAAVVRAPIVDDNQPPALEPRHGHRTRTVARAHHRADRHVDVRDARRAVVRVVAQDVEELGSHGGHSDRRYVPPLTSLRDPVRRPAGGSVTLAMQPFTQPYQPAGIPPIKRAFRRLAILFGVVVLGLVLLVGGFYLYHRFTPQHAVLIDNGNGFAVELDVGDTHVALAAHASKTVRARDGKLAITAKGPSFSESVTVDFPATSFFVGGRRAIYNIGGASKLAVVTVEYGSVLGAPEFLEPLAAEPRLHMLPGNVTGDIDDSFPESKQGRRGMSGSLERRVCHVDYEAKRVGCAGAVQEDKQ